MSQQFVMDCFCAFAVILSVLLQSGRADLVCDIGFKLCDSTCYDPSTLNCLESGEYKVVCPKGMKMCGTECYSAGVCLSANGISVPCLPDQQLCGDHCFNPSTEKCVDNAIVCDLDDRVCGTGEHMQCYRPAKSECTLQGKLCRPGQSSCGRHCFSPRNGTTCFRNRILCNAGRTLCGDGPECYSEAYGETCVNGMTVCKVGQVLCGKFTCYDPNDSKVKCNLQEGSHIGVVCSVGQSVCEGKCFDTGLYDCFPYRGMGLICPKGQQGCGGINCYTPNTPDYDDGGHVYQCLANDAGDEVLCRSGQSLCGVTCYNPGNDLKCVRDMEGLEILCRNDEQICGNTCFDPNTQICYPTPAEDTESETDLESQD